MDKAEIIKIAVAAALDHQDKIQKKLAKERHDRRLRNTGLLLRNYTVFKDHCKSSIYDIKQIDETNPLDMLEDISSLDSDEYIESIKRSVNRTKIIIAHIEKMMDLYAVYCQQSRRSEDMRRYRVVKAMYFDKELVEDIARREGVDARTCFRDSREARETISALMFGLDGLAGLS